MRAGVLFSTEKAVRSARFVVAYNEMRGLYEVDLRTWVREREVYQRHLDLADTEIARQRERARRGWWERHGAQVGLAVGFLVGAAATVGIVAAVNEVSP